MNFKEVFVPENSFAIHENVCAESCELDLQFDENLLVNAYCDEHYLVGNNNPSLSVAENEQTSKIEFDLDTVLFEDQNDACYFQDPLANEESSEFVVENEPCYLVGNPVTVSESNSSKEIVVEDNLVSSFQNNADGFLESNFLVENLINNDDEMQTESEDLVHVGEDCSSFYVGLSDQTHNPSVTVPTSSNCEHISEGAATYYLPRTNDQNKDNSNNNNSSTIFSDYEVIPSSVVVDQSLIKIPKKLKRKAVEDDMCYLQNTQPDLSSSNVRTPKKCKTDLVQVEIYQEEPQG